MKVLLIALNASYTHTNLAVRTLAASLRNTGQEAAVYESTINQPPGRLFMDIAGKEWEVAAFSCYIWNIDLIRRLTAQLALVHPDRPILWGGPEVSHDTAWWLSQNPGVTCILRGEGERALPDLIGCINAGQDMMGLAGIAYRTGKRIVDQGMADLVALDQVPFPYAGGIEGIRDRILYYESSRGCPFSCGYCLSGAGPGVRYRSLAAVKSEIRMLSEWGARLVKFVDRTFNSDPVRAAKLLDYIAGLDTRTLFHFEICADLLDERAFAVLAKMPPGRAQLEIGVQSATPAVLEASTRRTDISRIGENVRRLREMGHIHLHLDLIAGLPGETGASFAASFNRVWAMGAERLQVGFLKLLRGSRLRESADAWGCRYSPDAPYEVLATGTMSYSDLAGIHRVEEMVERYGNTGRYALTLRRLIDRAGGDAYSVFKGLATFMENRYPGGESPSFAGTYDDLHAFGVSMGENPALLADLVKYDFVSHAKPKKYPSCLAYQERKDVSRLIRAALDAAGAVRGDVPLDEGKAHVARFSYDVLGDVAPAPGGVWLLFLYGDCSGVYRLPPHS